METFYISRISKTASIRILKLSSGASSINSRGTFCNINFKTIGLIAIIYFDRKIYYRSKEKLHFLLIYSIVITNYNDLFIDRAEISSIDERGGKKKKGKSWNASQIEWLDHRDVSRQTLTVILRESRSVRSVPEESCRPFLIHRCLSFFALSSWRIINVT